MVCPSNRKLYLVDPVAILCGDSVIASADAALQSHSKGCQRTFPGCKGRLFWVSSALDTHSHI